MCLACLPPVIPKKVTPKKTGGGGLGWKKTKMIFFSLGAKEEVMFPNFQKTFSKKKGVGRFVFDGVKAWKVAKTLVKTVRLHEFKGSVCK